MRLEKFECGPIGTNAYLLESDGEVVAFDPAAGSAEYLDRASKVFLTHSHWDHIVDCATLGLPVAVHALDAENVRKPGTDGLFTLCPPFEGVEPSHLLEDGEVVQVGSLELEVIHTPGHSPGSVCFYCASEGFVIAGDLVFCGAVGRTDLPTAEPEKMRSSLGRIARLPAGTIIYSGHGPDTTVEKEFAHGTSRTEGPSLPGESSTGK